MTKVYKVKPYSTRRFYFMMCVSQTQREMNAYIRKRSPGAEHDAQTLGLVSPTSTREFPNEGHMQWFSTCFATMYLCDDHLTHEIVAHECLHVAMAHERWAVQFHMDYGEQIEEDEERLCYCHGRIVEAVWKTLRKGSQRRTR